MKNELFDRALAWLEWVSKVVSVLIHAIRNIPPLPGNDKTENRPTNEKIDGVESIDNLQ